MRGIVRWTLRGLLALVALCVLALVAVRGSAAWREGAAVEPPAQGRMVTLSDGRMFVQIRGPESGIPVVLVHGTAAWSGFWSATADQLASRGYRVAAIDLPPFGFSDRSKTGDYSRSEQARRIRDVVRGLNFKDTIVVGHSFGAGPVVEAAMLYPENFAGMVLISGALGLPESGDDYPADNAMLRSLLAQPFVAETLVAATFTNPWLTRRFLAAMLFRKEAATDTQVDILQKPQRLSGTTEGYARWLPYLLFPDRAAKSAHPQNYASLRLPAALIWGREDSVTPLGQAERLNRLIAGSSLDVIDGVGHIAHIEDPERLIAVLAKRLKDIKPQASTEQASKTSGQ